MSVELESCPVCSRRELHDFFAADRVSVFVGKLYTSVAQAKQATVGNIHLAFCDNCSHVFNRTLDLDKLRFEPGYDASLGHSAVVQQYTESVVNRLIETYQLPGKRIVELGCGTGDFLQLICQRASCDGTGIDPTIDENSTIELEGRTIRFIQGMFDESHTSLPCDFLTCVSVLEDIQHPSTFLQHAKSMMQANGAAGYFEAFNAQRAFESMETWSVHYEQCNYFSLPSFVNLFRSNGFDVTRATTCFQGEQYLAVDVIPSNGERKETNDCTQGRVEISTLQAFANRHAKEIETWQNRLKEFEALGKRVVSWGSGGKGISFLNALDSESTIPFVVDINPSKHGKYVPLTCQEIVSPDRLKVIQPDVIIVMNGMYEAEIRQHVSEMGIDCSFFVA